MYSLAAWYVVVSFAEWCFYSESPVDCYNGIMGMTTCPHAFEGKSPMRNYFTTNSGLTIKTIINPGEGGLSCKCHPI